jgi:hypothetical protein
VLAALLIGLGAVAIVGLRAAQDRVLGSAATRDAGDAAIEAAAVVIADAYVAHLDTIGTRAFDVPRPTPDVDGLLADPGLRESARAAAVELAALNGAVFAGVIDARCAGKTIEIELRHARRLHRVALEAEACSPR